MYKKNWPNLYINLLGQEFSDSQYAKLHSEQPWQYHLLSKCYTPWSDQYSSRDSTTCSSNALLLGLTKSSRDSTTCSPNAILLGLTNTAAVTVPPALQMLFSLVWSIAAVTVPPALQMKSILLGLTNIAAVTVPPALQLLYSLVWPIPQPWRYHLLSKCYTSWSDQ